MRSVLKQHQKDEMLDLRWQAQRQKQLHAQEGKQQLRNWTSGGARRHQSHLALEYCGRGDEASNGVDGIDAASGTWGSGRQRVAAVLDAEHNNLQSVMA
jgi:hypothetical protein